MGSNGFKHLAPRLETADGSRLSSRQLQVATLAAQGYSNREIAGELRLSLQVTKNTLHAIFDKLGIWNRVELANRFSRQKPPAQRDGQQSLACIEAQRLAELERRNILDSRREKVFDEIAALAAAIFEVPMALVAFIDSNRVWFKASVGLSATQVPRELTICQHTIRRSKVNLVADSRCAGPFMCNPAMEQFGLRFYAAAPILTEDGYALGVVCVVDRKPRAFTQAKLAALQSLARVAMLELDSRLERRGKPAPTDMARPAGIAS